MHTHTHTDIAFKSNFKKSGARQLKASAHLFNKICVVRYPFPKKLSGHTRLSPHIQTVVYPLSVGRIATTSM